MAQIVGEPAEWFHHIGSLQVKVVLNQTDESAIQANQGKAAPRMLVNASAKASKFARAVVVDPGSILEFHLRSTGPWGFGYRIVTGNTSIVHAQFSVSTRANTEKETVVRRYQDHPTTIRVDDWATLGKHTKEAQSASWHLDFKAWGVLGFKLDGRSYGVPSTPGGGLPLPRGALAPPTAAEAPSTPQKVRGGGITAGDASDTEKGTITRLNHRGPEHESSAYVPVFLLVATD